jgi:hypothetical protein
MFILESNWWNWEICPGKIFGKYPSIYPSIYPAHSELQRSGRRLGEKFVGKNFCGREIWEKIP